MIRQLPVLVGCYFVIAPFFYTPSKLSGLFLHPLSPPPKLGAVAKWTHVRGSWQQTFSDGYGCLDYYISWHLNLG